MRRFTALLLTFTLLAVSSLPTVAEAATCSAAAHRLALQHTDSVATTTIIHHHHALLNDDWQGCRIECGCGCHRNMDVLPHLLAPSTLSIDALPILVGTGYLPVFSVATLHDRPQPPSPPPPITS